jgi:hypothetical protein
MRKTINSVRRAIINWQLSNLESSIQHILIARNHALATMIELKKERAAKEQQLAHMEAAST